MAKQKTIVITGASQGVGKHLCEVFIKANWKVIALSRSEDKLLKMQSASGENFSYHPLDVCEPNAVKETFEKIEKRFESIDVLVNNAAIFKMRPFDSCDIQDINQIVDTNLKGVMYCTHSALPGLKNGGGRIINICSVSGTRGIENQAIYSASKYGMNGFAESLNQELIPHGVSISTIFPGGIDTPLWNEDNNPYPDDVEKLLQPEDITSLVMYIVNLAPRVIFKSAVLFPSNEWH